MKILVVATVLAALLGGSAIYMASADNLTSAQVSHNAALGCWPGDC